MTPGNRSIFFTTLIMAMVTFFLAGPARGEGSKNLPGRGTVIPAFSLPAPSGPAEKSYLMLNGEKSFQPGNLKAKLVLIEVFNVYCASCQFMRPYMNELYTKIEKDPELKGQVIMMGIGAGNDHWDIDLEKASYKFPIFPDADYEFHNLVGKPSTPFLIFAKPYTGGRLLVVNSHLGRLENSDKLLAMTRAAYNTDISEIASPLHAEVYQGTEERPAIPISEEELMKKVRASLSEKGEELIEIKKIVLPQFGPVYIGTLLNSREGTFARVVARKIPCSDCHDVFFVYSFDDKGEFLKFIPISISKLGNESWDEADVNKIRNSFRNKSLLREIPFHAEIDAVTAATISSKLIYDSINKTRSLIEKLVDLGYMSVKK